MNGFRSSAVASDSINFVAESGSKLRALQMLSRGCSGPFTREASGVRPACRRFYLCSGRSLSQVARLLILLVSALLLRNSSAAEIPKVPVPKSPYISVVYRYADTLLEHGRDTYGPQKSGLFLSALDRATLQPLTNRPPAPDGVREEDRVGRGGESLTGSNPQHDQNLLRL